MGGSLGHTWETVRDGKTHNNGDSFHVVAGTGPLSPTSPCPHFQRQTISSMTFLVLDSEPSARGLFKEAQ